MSTQPERVSVEQLLQRLRYAEDAYGERLAAETEQLRAENEKLRVAMRLIRDAGPRTRDLLRRLGRRPH